MKTSEWLRELGAVRPMATAADHVLVLGKWHEGFYPITWHRVIDTMTTDATGMPFNTEPVEHWTLFGVAVRGELSRQDCERILSQVQT